MTKYKITIEAIEDNGRTTKIGFDGADDDSLGESLGNAVMLSRQPRPLLALAQAAVFLADVGEVSFNLPTEQETSDFIRSCSRYVVVWRELDERMRGVFG